MCEALKELFADDFKESELKGRNAGRTEGAASKIIEKLLKSIKKDTPPKHSRHVRRTCLPDSANL